MITDIFMNLNRRIWFVLHADFRCIRVKQCDIPKTGKPYKSWLQATIKTKGEEEGWNPLELVMKTRMTTVGS